MREEEQVLTKVVRDGSLWWWEHDRISFEVKRKRKEEEKSVIRKKCVQVCSRKKEKEKEKRKNICESKWREDDLRSAFEEQAGLGVSTGEKNTKSFESVRCMHVLIYGRDPAARYRVPT